MSDIAKNNSNIKKTRITRSGFRGIIRRTTSTFIILVILLISAGQLDWINAWIYTGLYLFFWILPSILTARTNPELINARGKFVQKDTQSFDRFFFRINPLLSIMMAIISGLDAVRYEWSRMPLELNIFGIGLLISAFSLAIWAMKVNTYFETTIRIQADRGQKVCTSGPYKIIRHPGYLSMVLVAFGNPLVLGSWWGLVPGGLMVLLVVARTVVEDRFLQNELAGYGDYTNDTRYRLCPYVW